MPSAPLMLGVSGCRGIVGESLTSDVACRYAAAFGSWLRERSGARPRVVLGRDGRAGGQMIQQAALAGLTGVGCDVTDLGIEMTPTVGVMVDELEAAGGLVLTASHNPQPWNGLKCLVREPGARGVSASAPDAATAGEIVDRFRSTPPDWQPWDRLGAITPLRDAASVHVARVLDRFGADVLEALHAMKPTVVLDSVNGAGIVAGLRLLERMGCSVVHLGNDDSGIFPHTPEPTRENLTDLADAVRAQGAVVGFAQDPDGDRLAVVDARGHYVGEEHTLVLAAREVFEMGVHNRERASRAVATNLSTSRMIDDVAADYDVRVERTAVGEANVVSALKSHDMVVGGEGNGGLIWSSVTYVRDSLSAMALILASIARTNRQVADLVAMAPGYAIEKRKVDLASRAEADPAVAALAAWADTLSGVRADRADGIRIDWDDYESSGPAWVHVRASNTEPIMRLIAEARSGETVSALLEETSRVIAG